MLATGHLFSLSVWFGPCCGYAVFIYPSYRVRNLTFNYIDVVYFTWASSIPEPQMNLWCAPNSRVPQSHNYLYHEQVPTNGSNPLSFPYSDYKEAGICHVQVESSSGDDGANTPYFRLTSNDHFEPMTWGLNHLGKAGGHPVHDMIQALPSIPSSVLAAAIFIPSSSANSTSLSSSASSHIIISSTFLASPTSASTTQTPPPPQHSTSSQSSSDNTSPTPVTKASISISSIVAFLFIALLLLLAWYLRSWQRQQQPVRSQREVQEKRQRAAEIEERKISMYEVGEENMPNELQGRPKAELLANTGALDNNVCQRWI